MLPRWVADVLSRGWGGFWRSTERGCLFSPTLPHSTSPPQTQDQPSEPPSPTSTPCGKAPICVPARRDLVESPASLASSLSSPLPRAKELVLVRSRGGVETHFVHPGGLDTDTLPLDMGDEKLVRLVWPRTPFQIIWPPS